VAELATSTSALAAQTGSRAVFGGYVNPRRISLYHEIVDVIERSGVDLLGKRIVDVGAFYGHFLLAMHSRHPEARYYGLECADACRPIATELCPFAMVKSGTIDTIDERYDILVCMEVLEHLTEPETALNKLANSADLVCLTVPNGRYDCTPASVFHPGRES
jgi:2-polyprenyl-3-methyl-5-hydroxy-6-metoxy-1,4-benzoquinol methylase